MPFAAKVTSGAAAELLKTTRPQFPPGEAVPPWQQQVFHYTTQTTAVRAFLQPSLRLLSFRMEELPSHSFSNPSLSILTLFPPLFLFLLLLCAPPKPEGRINPQHGIFHMGLGRELCRQAPPVHQQSCIRSNSFPRKKIPFPCFSSPKCSKPSPLSSLPSIIQRLSQEIRDLFHIEQSQKGQESARLLSEGWCLKTCFISVF